MSYDQWKTASPYDDEPDIVKECGNLADEIQRHIDIHGELSDLTHVERILFSQCRDTLREAARVIEEEL